MNKRTTIALFMALCAVFAGCEARTDRTDSGGVTLSITDFDGLPIRIGVNASGSLVQVGELSVDNIAKNPLAPTSDLMNVEISSYEVVYTRADRGTRVPPKLVRGLFGVAPVGGTFDVIGLDVMGAEQFQTPPLSDLFFQNGGFDKETGNTLVVVNFHLRFFGKTISGDEVESNVGNFTIEFVP